MSDAWYESVGSETPLTQGDVIQDCPLITWAQEPIEVSATDQDEVLKGATTAIRADVVVMTQACDLEHSKLENVILCPHLPLGEYKDCWEEEMRARDQNPTNKAWVRLCDDIRDGFVWNLAMLNKGSTGDLTTEHRIVDFHSVYPVPRRFLESVLQGRGTTRLRLLPPYREHLSQAFARFFMRVGLPTPVEKDW